MAHRMAAIELSSGMPPDVAHAALHHMANDFDQIPDWAQRLWIATVATLEDSVSRVAGKGGQIVHHCEHCPASHGFPEADPCPGMVILPLV
jgi:hypothetical protein